MPQDERCIIRSKIAPEIPLDDMVMEDLFTGTSTQLPEHLRDQKSGRQYHLDVGTNYPQITINSYTFKQGEIVRFEIEAYGFLPRVYLKIALIDSSAFKSHGFPKDGDILSIFIRAKDDAFKPIRNDYLVTSVIAGKGAMEGRGSNIELFGELFIPHFHDEVIKSYNGNTFDVLQNVCRDLGLGFATNETYTADLQNWICTGDTYANFIPYIVKHAWKDESSFYTCYIDVYYHLNFINVNNQVDGDGKLDAAILDTTMFKNFYSDVDAEQEAKTKTGKLLSDMDNLKGTNMFIRTYEVENNSSKISKDWGYKSYVRFFDQKSGTTWELYVDPITSSGAEQQKILLKGRPYPKAPDGTAVDKYWQTQNKYFWRGIQYKDVHDKYLFSEMWNERNMLEVNKFNLNVYVERWNPNIYRGERIPIILHTMGDNAKRILDRSAADENQSPDNYTAVMDQFYSGYYMVDGVKWTYSMTDTSTDYANPGKPPFPSGFVQVFRMKRRELPVPGGPPQPNSANTPTTGTPGQV